MAIKQSKKRMLGLAPFQERSANAGGYRVAFLAAVARLRPCVLWDLWAITPANGQHPRVGDAEAVEVWARRWHLTDRGIVPDWIVDTAMYSLGVWRTYPKYAAKSFHSPFGGFLLPMAVEDTQISIAGRVYEADPFTPLDGIAAGPVAWKSRVKALIISDLQARGLDSLANRRAVNRRLTEICNAALRVGIKTPGHRDDTKLRWLVESVIDNFSTKDIVETEHPDTIKKYVKTMRQLVGLRRVGSKHP